jgi:16S rRNA processing protein RimM
LDDKTIRIGKILAPWGVKGQVKVEPLTDNIRRYDNLKSALIKYKDELVCMKIESVLYLKNAYVVVKFEGIDSPKEAENLRNEYINIFRKDAIKLPTGHYFICDIIGLDVYDEKQEYIGTITDVLQTGANDVYVVKRSDKEFLLPAIKDVILNIDIDNNQMIVRLMEGML